MPEIKQEIPDDPELYEYLRQSFHGIDLASGRLTFLEAESAIPEVNRFVIRLGESIFAGLRRLNQLARSDPFWRNTKRRPTVFKLPELCQTLLREQPKD